MINFSIPNDNNQASFASVKEATDSLTETLKRLNITYQCNCEKLIQGPFEHSGPGSSSNFKDIWGAIGDGSTAHTLGKIIKVGSRANAFLSVGVTILSLISKYLLSSKNSGPLPAEDSNFNNSFYELESLRALKELFDKEPILENQLELFRSMYRINPSIAENISMDNFNKISVGRNFRNIEDEYTGQHIKYFQSKNHDQLLENYKQSSAAYFSHQAGLIDSMENAGNAYISELNEKLKKTDPGSYFESVYQNMIQQTKEGMERAKSEIVSTGKISKIDSIFGGTGERKGDFKIRINPLIKLLSDENGKSKNIIKKYNTDKSIYEESYTKHFVKNGENQEVNIFSRYGLEPVPTAIDFLRNGGMEKDNKFDPEKWKRQTFNLHDFIRQKSPDTLNDAVSNEFILDGLTNFLGLSKDTALDIDTINTKSLQVSETAQMPNSPEVNVHKFTDTIEIHAAGFSPEYVEDIANRLRPYIIQIVTDTFNEVVIQ